MKNWYVIQAGHGVFGSGDTPDEAVADSREWVDGPPLDANTIPRFAGGRASRLGSWPSGTLMTDQGEMSDGMMVLMSGEDAAELGYDVK